MLDRPLHCTALRYVMLCMHVSDTSGKDLLVREQGLRYDADLAVPVMMFSWTGMCWWCSQFELVGEE